MKTSANRPKVLAIILRAAVSQIEGVADELEPDAVDVPRDTTDAEFLRGIADDNERAMKYMNDESRARFEVRIARLRKMADQLDEVAAEEMGQEPDITQGSDSQ